MTLTPKYFLSSLSSFELGITFCDQFLFYTIIKYVFGVGGAW